MNELALTKLDVRTEIGSSDAGVRVRLVPGGRAGAIPLRSAQTGQVASGFIVEPRFGWSGVGNVLSQTGWAAAPEFLEGPLVPGSGREVPPWVLAGPVLARLAELLDALRRGYHTKEEVLQQPRGRILWGRYISESLATGRWANLPCRYPELASDPLLRRMARWGLERVRRELATVGGRDPVARVLVSLADDLLFRVRDVLPLVPRRSDLDRVGGADGLLGLALRRGLEALGWDAREAHRADVHQVLAYAGLYAAEEVHATLVYPLRQGTFEALARRGRDRSVAHLLHGARRVRLELRGVAFGAEARARD